jgi:nitronate monooxygenase
MAAPIGGFPDTSVVSAVSAAGGLGVLPSTWLAPGDIAAQVAAIRAQTTRPFAANLVLVFDVEAQLDALLAARVPVIAFSWGRPGGDVVARCHAAGARVALQIGTPGAVAGALSDGVDVLIAQGVEAGGHVQSTTPLAALLPHVLEAAHGAVPIVATGGLATAADVRAVIHAGAAAAMLGTRFLASTECSAHPRYKEALVAAQADDTCCTICFDGGWPFAAHRVLRNATVDAWEAAGCPPPGKRPGERDAVATRVDGGSLTRYAEEPPRDDDVGEILDCCLYAGTSVTGITDIRPATEIVHQLDPA